MKNKERILFLILALILCFVGQLIKNIIVVNLNNSVVLINGVINLSLVKNTGGAFSIGNNNILIFIILNIFIIIGFLVYYFKNEDENKLKTIGIILVLAGALSNLSDRIFRGYVVDYIDINELIKYPVFNLEDMMIVSGIIIFAIYILKKEKNGQIRN